MTEHTFTHGASGYTNYGCRCEVCRAGNTAMGKAGRVRRHQLLVDGVVSPPHGVLSTYFNYRCSCEECRAAHARYQRTRTH